ncbi:MAG: hypothetical protein IKD76_01275 [Clostridia bacterium]|nr:hypothetical protein [Clostridia bacterium]
MEKRVIKFSLVGVICVLIAIAVGIGALVYGLSGTKGEKVGEKIIDKTAIEEQNTSKDEVAEKTSTSTKKDNTEKKKNSVKKEVTEYTDTVVVNGEEQEVEFKVYKSNLGYQMAYDVSSFYVQYSDIDEYKSLLTDTIYVNISKKKGDFDALAEELVNATNTRVQRNSGYTLSQNSINGKRAFKEMETDASGVTRVNYYIYSGNGEEYFVVNAVCGKEVKDYTLAVVDKMVETFKV